MRRRYRLSAIEEEVSVRSLFIKVGIYSFIGKSMTAKHLLLGEVGKDYIPEKMVLNGRVVTVFKPKDTMSLEEFEKAIEPIIKKMAEKERSG